MHGAGLQTVGDLQDYAGDLRALVGSFGPTLKRFAVGEGATASEQMAAHEVAEYLRQITGADFRVQPEDKKSWRTW